LPAPKTIDPPMPVVLASASPTRRELLGGLLTRFEVVAPQVDEASVSVDDPRERAVELARRKAAEVAARRPDALVIGADTLIVCRGDVIGKPADLDDAARILHRLSHNPHSVITGVHVIHPDGRSRSACAEAVLRMYPMSAERIAEYLAGFDPLHRAGAYAIEADDPNVERLSGSVTGVMGLPMEDVEAMLRDLLGAGHGRPT